MPERGWAARLVAVGLGLGLIVALEGLLRLTGAADSTGWTPPRLVYVVQNGEVQGEFEARVGRHFVDQSVGGQPGVRTSRTYALGAGAGFPVNGSMRDEHFTRTPAAGVDRYFVLGGSAAMGQAPIARQHGHQTQTERLPNGVRALPDAQALSGQVEQRLTQAGRTVEVINAGMIAQDSAGVLRIAQEVLAFKPTGLLVYMGNNEGIGLSAGMGQVEVPRLEPVASALHRLRLYRVLADRLVPLRQRLEQAPKDVVGGLQPEVLGRISLIQWQSAGTPLMDGDLPTDDVYHALLQRFERNLRALVTEAAAHGTEVIVVPTPPHLGYAPFFTSYGPHLAPSTIQELDAALKEGEQALKRGDLDRARSAAEQAVALDPYSAGAAHLLGRVLDASGAFSAAVDALVRAHALDLSRKRSQPGFAQVAQQVCAELGCQTVDAHKKLVEHARMEGLSAYTARFGDHEHLHPEGNAWVADLMATLLLAEEEGGG